LAPGKLLQALGTAAVMSGPLWPVAVSSSTRTVVCAAKQRDAIISGPWRSNIYLERFLLAVHVLGFINCNVTLAAAASAWNPPTPSILLRCSSRLWAVLKMHKEVCLRI